jgi:hypothetical protein
MQGKEMTNEEALQALEEAVLFAKSGITPRDEEVFAYKFAFVTLRKALAAPTPQGCDVVPNIRDACDRGTLGCVWQHEPDAPTVQPTEPVAWLHHQGNFCDVSLWPLGDYEKAHGWTEEPLYTHPAQPAELRRLHAVNQQLLEALEETVQDSDDAVAAYIATYGESFRSRQLQAMRDVVSRARAALAAAKETRND